MKLLFTMPHKKEGGVYSFCHSVLPHMQSQVVMFRRGARTNETIWIKPLVSLFLIARYCALLVRRRPDAIFINTSIRTGSMMRDGLLIVLAKLCRVVVVTYIHGFDEKCLNRRLLPAGIFLSDMLFVLSDSFARTLKSRGFRGRIVRSMNPVTPALYAAAKQHDPVVRKKPCNLLFLSRVEKEKGIFTVLKMYESLRKERPELNLLVAGDGTAMETVRQFIRDRALQSVELLGFVTGAEKVEAYRKADIYVFASQDEGLPISVLEAMLFGLPVVTYPAGGIKDFFIDGKMGALVPGSEPEHFAVAAKDLLFNNDLRHEIAQYNIKYARENFNPEVVTNALEQHISELVYGIKNERSRR